MHGRSLRWRVTVSVLVLMLLTLAALSTSVDLALGNRLRGDIRTRLSTRAEAAAQVGRLIEPQTLANQLTGDGVTATVTTPDGQEVTGRPAARPVLPRRGRRLRVPIAPIVQLGDQLTVTQPVVGGRTVLLTAPLTEINRALSKLKAVEVAVSAVLLALVTLVINTISRRALSPLDRMTSTAREIAAGQRGRRLTPEHPDTEIGRTATAIDEMLDALEASEVTMRNFLGDASHELRTPIASLQAGAETLLRSELTRDEREQLAVSMVRESQRASRLVEDLLAIARLDAPGESTTSPVDVVVVAAEAVARLASTHPDVSVLVTAPPTFVITANHDELLQVLGNLLDNAVAAAGPELPIELVIRLTSDGVEITVSDHGPGVPDADKLRIFDRFVRLDRSRHTSTGSNGLGLAIVEGLVKRAGGTVSCHDRTDGQAGARFVIFVPK